MLLIGDRKHEAGNGLGAMEGGMEAGRCEVTTVHDFSVRRSNLRKSGLDNISRGCVRVFACSGKIFWYTRQGHGRLYVMLKVSVSSMIEEKVFTRRAVQ